jgi:hypothetical protein
MMVIWCIFESIYLFNVAAVFYGAVGITQAVLCVLMLRQRRESE